MGWRFSFVLGVFGGVGVGVGEVGCKGRCWLGREGVVGARAPLWGLLEASEGLEKGGRDGMGWDRKGWDGAGTQHKTRQDKTGPE